MKILVRHAMGAGGWFICGLIYSMLEYTDTEITRNGSGHNLEFMYHTHTLDQLVQGPLQDKFWYYCEEEFNSRDDISEGIEWFKKHLHFNEKGLVGDWHIMRTHARNLNPLVYAMGTDNVKIINIHHKEEELDQMIYNFVYKTIFTEPNWLDNHLDELQLCLKYHYPNEYWKITPVTLKDAIDNRDAKYLTIVLKMAWKQYWERYPLYKTPDDFNVFDLHWHEIADASLINRLPELEKFLGITLEDSHLAKVKQSILDYQALQKPIPFKL